MKNIFRELIEKEKEVVELSNELQKTKELLSFSLDEKEEIEKSKLIQKKQFMCILKKLLDKAGENNYKKPEIKLRQLRDEIREYENKLKEV